MVLADDASRIQQRRQSGNAQTKTRPAKKFSSSDWEM